MPDRVFVAWRTRVEAALDHALPSPDLAPWRLHAAMRHAVLNGGKRMRPMLVYASGLAMGTNEEHLDAGAVAVELIHCYSLVHDDLPAMDDDRLRRGQPTVHVAFDEATAILAGDALQSLAFELLASAPLDAGRRVSMLAELARASGVSGMCGGQALDIDATGAKPKRGQVHFPAESAPDPVSPFSLADLEHLHALKTGALLRASVRLGALAAGADANGNTGTLATMDRFADALGLAFQIRDDLLDIEGDTISLGKTAGKDAAQHKATFPALIGVEGSRLRLAQLSAAMADALATLDADTTTLAALGRLAIERTR